MPSSLVTNDSATGNNVDLSNGVTELSSQINSNGVGVSGVTIEPDTPPPPAALAFWDDFYAKGSYSEDWIYKAVDDYNERKVGGNVIIVGGHAGHSLGDLIGDAGGISGLDNGYGSGNQNTENDALFRSVYEKMSDEDRERLATTSLVISVSTGQVLGEYNEQGNTWADAAHDGANPNNSIEGQTINLNGKNYTVAESTFRWSSPVILDMDGLVS